MDEALLYVEMIMEMEMEIVKITHTGHSLGGFIAGACAGLSTGAYAVTFECPGIGILDIRRDMVGDRIINYVTNPSIINTGGEHVGEIRQLCVYPSYDVSYVKICVNFFDGENFNIFLKDLLHICIVHSLDRIIEYIGKGGTYKIVHSWPRARNRIIYGIRPEFTLFNSIQHFVVMFGATWYLPIRLKYNAQTGKVVQIVGFAHERDNLIIYADGTRSRYEGLELNESSIVEDIITDSAHLTSKIPRSAMDSFIADIRS